MAEERAPSAGDSATHRRIMRAAEELFKRSGFRGVTMEAIAREAAISKATLYSRFKNKDEVFAEVCERMAQLLRRTFADALATPDGTVDDRVLAALLGKHRLTFTLVRTSPHAEDLFSHKAQLAGELFARTDDAMVQELATVLREDPALRPAARRLARALFFGSSELAARGAGAAEIDAEVTAFVRVHLAGARTLAPTTKRPRRTQETR